jgi:iron-sulfur cluster repair protein YtfE (RIC family)
MTTSCGCGCGHGAGVDQDRTAARYDAATVVADVARDPAALAVLERLGVNHCCGAHLSLREGAAAAGVPLETLLTALNAPAGVRA